MSPSIYLRKLGTEGPVRRSAVSNPVLCEDDEVAVHGHANNHTPDWSALFWTPAAAIPDLAAWLRTRLVAEARGNPELAVPCPVCHALPGESCLNDEGVRELGGAHTLRLQA